MTLEWTPEDRDICEAILETGVQTRHATSLGVATVRVGDLSLGGHATS